MLTWYEDNYIGVKFDIRPSVSTRYPLPSMTEQQLQSIKRYPFINKRDLRVTLIDHFNQEVYEFSIPKGYTWDGASVPKLFWRIIGSNTDNSFLIASLIHDVLCENHHYVNNDRYFADKVFERLLYVAGVPAPKRWLMFHSVDNWQKFCHWDK